MKITFNDAYESLRYLARQNEAWGCYDAALNCWHKASNLANSQQRKLECTEAIELLQRMRSLEIAETEREAKDGEK